MAGFDVDAAVEDLYAVPRDAFTAHRKELSRQAKAAGADPAATAIAKLPKPTLAAWLANQLARRHADEVRVLVDLGDELRDATARLDGARLRALSQQKAAAASELTRLADDVADRPVSAAVARDLDELWTAAVTDPAVGDLVVAGRVASTVADDDVSWPTGVARPRPVSVSDSEHRAASGSSAPARARRPPAARARRELAEARRAVKDAEADRTSRERDAAAARSALHEASERVRVLTRELHEAEQRQRAAREQAAAADRAAKQADRTASRAWQRVQAAEAAPALAADADPNE